MTDQSLADAGKNILQSRTFWANLLGPVFLFLAAHYGLNLDADTQATIIVLVMSMVNIVLRKLTTQPITVLPAKQ